MEKVFSGGKVHLCAEQCDTCIFRPGNLMMLNPGRLTEMVKKATRAESVIPCHETLENQQAICRGYWDRYGDRVWTLRLAVVMNIIKEV